MTMLRSQDMGALRACPAPQCGRAIAVATLIALAGCGGDAGQQEAQPGAGVGADGYELVIVDDSRSAGADSAATAGNGGAAPAPAQVDTGGVVRFTPNGAFTVQVGMYTDAGLAAAEVRKLADSGYPAYAMARPDGRGMRVRIGYFATREEAHRFGHRFREDRGADYWVDRRANEEE